MRVNHLEWKLFEMGFWIKTFEMWTFRMDIGMSSILNENISNGRLDADHF